MDYPIWQERSFLYAALFGITTLLLLTAMWSQRRHRDPRLRIECTDSIDKLIPSLAGLTLGSCMAGNRVVILENKVFYDELFKRIATARHTVHFETFLWKDGMLGRKLAAALAEQARSGRQVRVLLDANGSRKIGEGAHRQMEEAGCRVRYFHEAKLRNIGVLNDRTHRKLVIIDGKEAFVGGHCIEDPWYGDPADGKHYGDITIHLTGPIVHSVQAAFSENWVGETGELLAGDNVFPPLEPAGEVTMHAAFVKPEGSAPAVKILHHTAICLARRRIWIQNPYFIPEPDAIDAFGQAVSRGVDVRVLMPATSGSDNPMVQHAGHRNFAKLLRCGVRLFEYPHTLLHQKVMTVDGIWSAVGSTNFDDRSFETNDEFTLGILDQRTAQQLDAIFERYVKDANEITLESWERRGVWHRIKDHACYLINELL